MEYLMAHKVELLSIFTAVVTIASIVAKMTPNETDNKVVFVLLKIADIFAINTKPTELKK